MRFPDRAGNPNPNYFFECLAFSTSEKGLEAYVAEFPQRSAEDQELHYHDGAELVFILEGELGLRYQNEEHVLRPGDSVYFDGAEPHCYRGRSEVPARAVVVTALPRL